MVIFKVLLAVCLVPLVAFLGCLALGYLIVDVFHPACDCHRCRGL